MPASSNGLPLLSAGSKPPRLPPVTMDALERELMLVFLRRYVTWCARMRRFDEMERAAYLWQSIRERSSRTVLMRERLKRDGR
jgi:hypothetical protein